MMSELRPGAAVGCELPPTLVHFCWRMLQRFSIGLRLGEHGGEGGEGGRRGGTQHKYLSFYAHGRNLPRFACICTELAPALNQPQLSQQYNDRTWVFVKYPRFSFAFSKKFNYYTSSSSRMIRFLSPCCWKSGLLNDVELVSPGQVISTGVLVLVSVIQRALRHNAPSMSWIEKQNISSLWHLNTV